MVVYRFYWRGPINSHQLIGVLPERRKAIVRITQESIMNWGKIYFGNTLGMDNIFIIPVQVDLITGRISLNLTCPS